MPYIKNDDGRREALQNGDIAQSAGELNYQIFYYVKHYDWRQSKYNNDTLMFNISKFINNFLTEEPNYQKYNDVTGCLIRCCKEIKRRLGIDIEREFEDILESYDSGIEIYEDKKILENGDVK